MKKKRAWLWLFAPRRGEALFPRRGEGRGGGANPLLISDVSIYLPLEKSEKRVQRRTGGVGKSLVNGGGFSFSASLVLLAKRKGAKEKRGGGGGLPTFTLVVLRPKGKKVFSSFSLSFPIFFSPLSVLAVMIHCQEKKRRRKSRKGHTVYGKSPLLVPNRAKRKRGEKVSPSRSLFLCFFPTSPRQAVGGRLLFNAFAAYTHPPPPPPSHHPHVWTSMGRKRRRELRLRSTLACMRFRACRGGEKSAGWEDSSMRKEGGRTHTRASPSSSSSSKKGSLL